jgi:hypothetical protein
MTIKRILLKFVATIMIGMSVFLLTEKLIGFVWFLVMWAVGWALYECSYLRVKITKKEELDKRKGGE